jgi:hypothetical protein
VDNEVAKMPEFEEISLELDPKSGTQEIDKTWECMICLMIVAEPQECSKCGKLICSACINQWLTNN